MPLNSSYSLIVVRCFKSGINFLISGSYFWDWVPRKSEAEKKMKDVQLLLELQCQLLQLKKLQELYKLKSQPPSWKEGAFSGIHMDNMETQPMEATPYDSEVMGVQAGYGTKKVQQKSFYNNRFMVPLGLYFCLGSGINGRGGEGMDPDCFPSITMDKITSYFWP